MQPPWQFKIRKYVVVLKAKASSEAYIVNKDIQ